jgi:tRNA nucleotidyltransferase (CCA-adding enzyme)
MANMISAINDIYPPELQGMLYLISSLAQKEAEEIYCSGSFVRDLLLGREQHRLNFIVSGSAVDFARQLSAIFPGKLIICDERPSTALILTKGFVFNMVTAKKEFNPFAEPEKQDTLKQNLFARDFTIDTLAFSLNMETFGELYDYFGGAADLEAGKLRVLYKMSFADNPIRILRLIRLEQRFGLSVEEGTRLLLNQALEQNILKKLSKESLSEEIRLLFVEVSPVKVLTRLNELDLFSRLFPRVNATPELFRRLQTLEGILQHTGPEEKTETVSRQDSYYLFYLTLLLSDLSAHDANYLCHIIRLKAKERLKLTAMMNAQCDFREMDSCVATLNKISMQ